MSRFRTHYDTLKVSRDAPIEVIQGAYRSLARKYHPDKTGSTSDAGAMMKAINAAYEVLSDPVARAKHDRWISAQLDRSGSRPSWSDMPHDGPNTTGEVPQSGEVHRRRSVSVDTIIIGICYASVALFLLRLPGPARIVGIVMLLAGIVILQRRAR